MKEEDEASREASRLENPTITLKALLPFLQISDEPQVNGERGIRCRKCILKQSV